MNYISEGPVSHINVPTQRNFHDILHHQLRVIKLAHYSKREFVILNWVTSMSSTGSPASGSVRLCCARLWVNIP